MSTERSPEARLRQLITDIQCWRETDRSGYDEAIGLLCDIQDELEALLTEDAATRAEALEE